jgi:hypothetical protein
MAVRAVEEINAFRHSDKPFETECGVIGELARTSGGSAPRRDGGMGRCKRVTPSIRLNFGIKGGSRCPQRDDSGRCQRVDANAFHHSNIKDQITGRLCQTFNGNGVSQRRPTTARSLPGEPIAAHASVR